MYNLKEDEELLGKIAFEFRGACNKRLSDVELDAFSHRYAEVVKRLIASGQWKECPPPEDQLPIDMMPESFFEYWYMERKPQIINRNPSLDERIGGAIGGVLFLALMAAGIFLLFSACGGCWDSGSRLFLK